MPLSVSRQSELFEDAPRESDVWSQRLLPAFPDPDLDSGFLPIAEQAIAARPGDPIILLLAATAALLDDRPERALVFLKRFSKRASAPAEHLLRAVALHQLNKGFMARALLEQQGLTNWPAAVGAFPGGSQRLRWLMAQLDAILDRPTRWPGRRPAARAKLKPRSAPEGVKAARPRKAPPPAAVAAAPVLPPLPHVDIEIPFTIELDLAPLLSAAAHAMEPDGRWLGLRERLAPLRPAQGIDEVLCPAAL